VTDSEGALIAVCCAFILGLFIGLGVGFNMGSHEQGVRDALAGKYVVVQLPDGTSVVVENKQEAGK
jgi:hypothetical protein